MTITKLDARQVISLDALNQLANGSSDVELDNLLRSIDSDLLPLLKLERSGTNIVLVGSATKTNPETGKVSALPPINGNISSFAGGSITLPATTGGSITVTPGSGITLTMSSSSFIKMGIFLNEDDDLVVTLGSEGVSAAAAGSPPDVPNSLSIGYVLIASDGGGNVAALTDADIYQYLGTNNGASAQSFQDRSAELIGGEWEWDSPNLIVQAAAAIQIPGLPLNANQIGTGTIALPNAESVAYVELNRTSSAPTVLTVNVADAEDVPQSNDVLIIARRLGTFVSIGTSSFVLEDGQWLDSNGAAVEISRRLDQLKLIPQKTPNLDQVYITGADIDQLDGTKISQELSNVFMDFTGATINFSTGVISGDANGINFTPFAVPSGHYFWYGVALVGDTVGLDNRISASVQITPATSSSAVAASAELPLIIGTKKLGAVQVFNTGSAIVVSEVRKLGVGSGSGSGEGGSGAPVEPANGFQMAFSDDFDVGPTSADSLVRDTETNASHNLSKGLFSLECDAVTGSATGTAVTLSGAAAFTVQPGDVIFNTVQQQFRRITAVTTQTSFTVDSAFPSNFTSESCVVSQAVWTEDLINNVGDAAQTTRPRDFYPNTDINEVHVDYFDTLAVDDDVPDFIDDARVVVSVSQDGLQSDSYFPTSNTFTPIFTRPNAPAQIPNYPLAATTNKQRLFLVFFCNPNNATVVSNESANVLKYKVSFYEDATLPNGGFLDSAFCMSDGSGTEINCQTPVVVLGKTELTLDWFYVGDVNSGETRGDLTVVVNGQELPRYVAGATLDAYYEEVPGDNKKIRFHTDLSVSPVSIEVYRAQGTLDTSDQNTLDLAGLQQSLVINSNTVLTRKKYQRVVTTGASITLTLPASPLAGDTVTIIDGNGSWGPGPAAVTVNRNGALIEGVALNDTLDVPRGWVEYEYLDVSQGWIVRA